MPVWHEATKEWAENDRIALLGITQEQHPDRCQLFAQWKQFDWPIGHDPINVIQSQAVPIIVAIDEHGITRSVNPRVETFEEDFLNRDFPNDAPEPAKRSPGVPDIDTLRQQAETKDSALAWRNLGDALVLWAGIDTIDEAVAAYRKAVERDPDDGNAHFRLGVALRMRHESPHRQPDDFQEAVEAWGQALAINPNQYIWRRRIQQYGPRLDKPYPFYDWVDQAIADIKERGDEPVTLDVRPYGAEIAHPSRQFETASAEQAETNPDPEGRIFRDEKGLIEFEPAVVPSTITPEQSARVHMTFRPNDELKAYWNNEVEPMNVWVEPPEGWQVSDQLLTAPLGDAAETRETRRLDFEVQAPSDASGSVTINSYALYYVCEGVNGTCLYLRQDIPITVEVESRE